MKKVCFLCNDINYKILASYNEPDQYEKSVKVKKKLL